MKHSVLLDGKEIFYTVRKHHLAKRMLLRVTPNREIVVTTPRRMPHFLVTTMLRLNAGAVLEAIARFEKRGIPTLEISQGADRKKYETHKEKARQLAHERLVALNMHYGFTYKRISIRCQRTRWGSCSKKGNLNFNYKIALMPPHLVDYIIVHELCHLGAFNHSPAFWRLVAQTVPDHKAIRQELRNFR